MTAMRAHMKVVNTAITLPISPLTEHIVQSHLIPKIGNGTVPFYLAPQPNPTYCVPTEAEEVRNSSGGHLRFTQRKRCRDAP
jgi:hypothetical protein